MADTVPAASALVALMYRPLWPGFALSGSVASHCDRRGRAARREGTLWLAPGGRFRAEFTDDEGDSIVEVCDGESAWIGRDGELDAMGASAAPIPFAELLNPAWVLAAYQLEITGGCEHAGRVGYSVTGTERAARKTGKAGPRPAGQIAAVVDAELGILLRYDKSGPGARTESAEFTRLEVRAAETAIPALFSRPEQAPLSSMNPVATPVGPGSGAPIGSDIVGLLYAGGLQERQFSAVLHEWADTDAIAARMRAEAAGHGKVVGGLVEFAADQTANADLTARLQMAIPGRYRIDSLTGIVEPACMVSDGQHDWQVLSDRVIAGASPRFLTGVSRVIDLAWLLDGYLLADCGTITTGERDGLVLEARPDRDGGGVGRGIMSRVVFPYDKLVVVVDKQLAVAAHIACSWHGQLIYIADLADLSEHVDPACFHFEPPSGSRIVDASKPWTALTVGDAVKTAVKAVKLGIDFSKRLRKER